MEVILIERVTEFNDQNTYWLLVRKNQRHVNISNNYRKDKQPPIKLASFNISNKLNKTEIISLKQQIALESDSELASQYTKIKGDKEKIISAMRKITEVWSSKNLEIERLFEYSSDEYSTDEDESYYASTDEEIKESTKINQNVKLILYRKFIDRQTGFVLENVDRRNTNFNTKYLIHIITPTNDFDVLNYGYYNFLPKGRVGKKCEITIDNKYIDYDEQKKLLDYIDKQIDYKKQIIGFSRDFENKIISVIDSSVELFNGKELDTKKIESCMKLSNEKETGTKNIICTKRIREAVINEENKKIKLGIESDLRQHKYCTQCGIKRDSVKDKYCSECGNQFKN